MTMLHDEQKPERGYGPAFLLILVMLVGAGLVYYFVLREDDVTKADLTPDATANYDVEINLYNGDLDVSAEIEVLNDSIDSWEEIGFDFVSSGLHDQGISIFLGTSLETRLNSVTDSEGDLFYKLSNNRFLIQLKEPLEPGEKKKISVVYTLRIQDYDGRHLGFEDDLFFSDWYPKIAQYDNGWVIPELKVYEETGYPTYSDFSIRYKLDDPRLVISSAVDGEIKESSSGTLEAKQIKDFSISFLKPVNWTSTPIDVNDTEMRFFWPVDGKLDQTAAYGATNAFDFYEENIGDHPSQEMDLLATSEVGSRTNVLGMGEADLNGEIPVESIAAFLAYQWFGQNLLTNPSTDAWVSVSLSDYIASAYMTENYEDEDQAFQSASEYVKRVEPAEYANTPSDEWDEWSYGVTLYGKTPLLLREFFNDKGGEEAAFRFLSAFLKKYQFQHVNSQTFASFLDDYFEGDQSEWLETWLKLDEK
ncbi:hypothetical protein [Planococcus shixiaomingii]|uniref:hypothetical protein n=1 Tax=Planococcus shixiaomingii TaxID=3058393 RepID=UPI002626058D|nr:hypothetical protein [Planococcus sp. N022]WKA56682.1 hypothetical protein QWY21_10140 [Planococcus sp. N022]